MSDSAGRLPDRYELVLDQYGFKWGPVSIIRLTSDARGVVIGIKTPHESLDLMVTPRGRVRIYDQIRRRTTRMERR